MWGGGGAWRGRGTWHVHPHTSNSVNCKSGTLQTTTEEKRVNRDIRRDSQTGSQTDRHAGRHAAKQKRGMNR